MQINQWVVIWAVNSMCRYMETPWNLYTIIMERHLSTSFYYMYEVIYITPIVWL